ncbi:MAG: ABC transporter permease, partial [Spirochaetaceae bacterium]|nr:ABC transporter permease [Spirochaetaceae bacterium]
LGNDLAFELNVTAGDEVTLVAVSGSSAVSLIDTSRVYTVSGIFTSGYSGINSAFVFVSDENKDTLFGENVLPVIGLKLKDSAADSRFIAKASKTFPALAFESWRSYNRAFFGALRIEKNMMMLLVLLIFVVVGVNIFNSLRRIVFERKDDIAVLSALGAKKNEIQSIFIFQGFLTGFVGAIPGTAAGLFLCINIDKILLLISSFSFHFRHAFYRVFAPDKMQYIDQGMMYNIFASVPPRIILNEVCLISIFGVFASLVAAWAASRGVLNLSCAEVLRDE